MSDDSYIISNTFGSRDRFSSLKKDQVNEIDSYFSHNFVEETVLLVTRM
jgi:hypothetical protein